MPDHLMLPLVPSRTLMRVWQRSPVKSVVPEQSQVKVEPEAEHTPPFRHGLEAHGFTTQPAVNKYNSERSASLLRWRTQKHLHGVSST